jgi:dephospho-CoA kinase
MRHFILSSVLLGITSVSALTAGDDSAARPDGEHRREQVREYLKNHPEARERAREWLKQHPEAREKLKERIQQHRGENSQAGDRPRDHRRTD